MKMLSRTRPEPKIDVISECIKLLGTDGENTKSIVRNMLIGYKKYLEKECDSIAIPRDCMKNQCPVAEELKEQFSKGMLKDKYYIENESELADVLCKYVYDHGGPDMTISYSFFNGLTVIDRDYSKDKSGLRITPTGFECYGNDSDFDYEKEEE